MEEWGEEEEEDYEGRHQTAKRREDGASDKLLAERKRGMRWCVCEAENGLRTGRSTKAKCCSVEAFCSVRHGQEITAKLVS